MYLDVCVDVYVCVFNVTDENSLSAFHITFRIYDWKVSAFLVYRLSTLFSSFIFIN